MSVLFNADNDQLKVTLSSALTIGTGDFVTAAWIRMTSATDVALFWAMVDVDPNATVSKRVWTDAANADITADEDGGGVLGHRSGLHEDGAGPRSRACATPSMLAMPLSTVISTSAPRSFTRRAIGGVRP